jgi:hypothetical protein
MQATGLGEKKNAKSKIQNQIQKIKIQNQKFEIQK